MMNKHTRKVLLVVTLIATVLIGERGFAQKEFKNLLTQTVRLTTDSTRIHASIIVETHEVKTDNEKYYFSYKGGEIKRVRGMIVGKIMDGPYSESDENNNILEAGQFDEGLKDGEWKTWYPTGELRSISTWKKGVLSGDYTEYNNNGELVLRQKYQDGKLHGPQVIVRSGVEEVTHFENGEQVEKQERKCCCRWFCRKKEKTKKGSNESKKSDKEKVDSGVNE